jgi:tetratricopeptide (TPR) repeat protein
MIVRDEEELLARCLQSVEGLADEVVVVDTGSSDRTVEIAEAHGARVHRFPWSDDFAAARNESLRGAAGDWILVLDADEWLDPESHYEIRWLVENTELTCYVLRRLNYADDEEPSSIVEGRELRLFPNHAELRYAGRDPYAQLRPTREDLELRIEPSHAIIHHDGYRPRIFEARGKAERNRLLLEQAVREEPDEPLHAYHLGLAYSVLERPSEAEAQLLRAIALSPSPSERGMAPPYLAGPSVVQPYLASAYLSLALAVFRQGRDAEAAAYCVRALELEPELADAHMALAAARVRLGRLDDALLSYERALALGFEAGAGAIGSPTPRWKPLLGIGEIYLLEQSWEEALPVLEEAAALSGGHPAVLLGLAHALRGLGRLQEAVEQLERATARAGAPPETRLLLAELLAEQGRVDEAVAVLSEARSR